MGVYQPTPITRDDSDDGRNAGDAPEKKSGRSGGAQRAAEEAGRSLNEWGVSQLERLASYKRGGKVRKSGRAVLHKGERVRRNRSKSRRRGRL